jgi:hypothetical protein
MRPLSLAAGLLLVGAAFGPFTSQPTQAASQTIIISDVYNALTPADEWVQLYNLSKSAVTLTGWGLCTNSACVSLPTTTIESYSLAKFKASGLTGWPAKGLDGSNDLVGLKDNNGKAIDSINWGTPSSEWKNYAAFKDLLWNPGVKPPDVNSNQSYFRASLGADNDKPTDWLALTKGGTTTPVPATVAPGVTPTLVVNSTTPTPTPTKNPTTGGEFPFLLAAGLVGALLGIRYFRRGVTTPRNIQ